MRRQGGESRLLVERHQPAIALDIGREDGDQSAIEGRCFDAGEPNPCRYRPMPWPEWPCTVNPF
jgi:hypothetical protein